VSGLHDFARGARQEEHLVGLPRIARLAAGVALHATATGVGLAAGTAAAAGALLGPPARAARTVAEVATGAVAESVTGAATGLARAAGAVVTGADAATEVTLDRMVEAGKAMFEPPHARRSRRVWVSRGRAHLELALPAVEGGPSVRQKLRRQLQRLDGVEWAAVNDAVGRVLVTFDERRVRVEDVIDVIAAVEQARGGTQVFPLKQDHPADLEPLVAALVTAAVDTAAIGVAFLGRALPVPKLTRHATLSLAFLDSQPWIKKALVDRIGATGTDLAFTGASALLHALTQSPTVPALNAAAAVQRAWEMRERRAVWQRREPELCKPGIEPSAGPLTPPGERPAPLPDGPIESYRSRLGPTALGAALGLLPLTFAPSRSADLLKALTPKAAVQGREAFASVLDALMCRRGVLPMDGSAYRRLDRVDAVVVDGATLCTGPPVVLEVAAEPAGESAGWDANALWTATSRLLGADGPAGVETKARLRLGPARTHPERPGARTHALRDENGVRVGTATVTDELDPYAEALLRAATEAGHRLVVTAHAGVTEIAGVADEVAPADEPLLDTVHRLQADGHGVLLVASGEGPGEDGAGSPVADAGPALLAADVSVAPARPGCVPAWGADLVTRAGLADACRIVAATAPAHRVSRLAVETALTGNVLGGLLAAVGSAERAQAKATEPGKSATVFTMALGAWMALRHDGRPGPAPTGHTPWHALEPDQVLRRLAEHTEPAPEPVDVAARLRRVAAAAARVPGVAGPLRYARTVAVELADPLTPVLGTGAAATALLGEAADAVLVGGVMVGSALLSGLQRFRAETALESLLLEQDVVAHREVRGGPDDGGREDVPAAALRVGDVIWVESGDVVPADARLLEAGDLEVDESGLTGESLAVAKDTAPTPGAVLGDRRCMLYEGTSVVAGRGRAVVVAVGDATAAGRATAAAGAASPPAGVQARLGELTRSVLPITLAGGGVVALLSVLWRRPLKDAVKSGVAIAVAAVPEGLPLVATVAQQAAARRLSRRGAVVRSARVLEALGRVDTVCFDKTGTLTENRLRVVSLTPLNGTGDDRLLTLAAAAGDPTDVDVHEVDRAVAAEVHERDLPAAPGAAACLPFTAGRGFSAAVVDGRLVIKGAPEVVLDRCANAGGARARVEELAADGLRVIAVADRAVEGVPDDLEEAAVDLRLRGLVALADGVRESTATAIAQLRAAGVRVLVATGDHPETASAIAAQAGVPDADRVVTGAEFIRASDVERDRMVRETAVFARLAPEQKVALVAALRRAGATLAMTGDGVNDAAAIRLADVGVGVGGAGGAESPAARRSADLVLTDADLTRLVDAIAEGRAMWGRVRDAVAVLVGGNAGEVAFTVLGTALGGRSPLGTRQLLLVNLLTDMFPALAVAVAAPRRTAPDATDPDDPLSGHPLAEELRAGPHRGFTTAVRRLVLVRGAATAAGATGAWVTGRLTGTPGRAGTMGLAALIGTQLAQTAWAGRRSPLVLVTAAGSLAVLVAVVQTPGVSRFFGCRPLGPVAWAGVLGWSAVGAAGAELVPRLVARGRAAQPPAPPTEAPADDTDTDAPPPAAETTTGAAVSVAAPEPT
jgi:cation-transporting ATPase I